MSVVKVSRGAILNSKIVSKFLRTLLPIYVIKVSSIHKIRDIPRNDLTLDGLVGRLTAFEIRNYGNSMVTIGNVFKSSITISNQRKRRKWV